MQLIQLIEYLEKKDPNIKVKYGFGEGDSYRGYYDELAFEPKRDTTVREMLKCAKDSLNSTYYGYKGGEYKMREGTSTWICNYGTTSGSQKIGKMLMDCITNQQGEE